MAAGASETGIAGGAAHPARNNIIHVTTIKHFFIFDLLSLISGIGLLPSNSANVLEYIFLPADEGNEHRPSPAIAA
jgi:hypothetical protein